MGWVLFEVFLAFGLAVFFVWWTFPKKKKSPKRVTDAAANPVADHADTTKQDSPNA